MPLLIRQLPLIQIHALTSVFIRRRPPPSSQNPTLLRPPHPRNPSLNPPLNTHPIPSKHPKDKTITTNPPSPSILSPPVFPPCFLPTKTRSATHNFHFFFFFPTSSLDFEQATAFTHFPMEVLGRSMIVSCSRAFAAPLFQKNFIHDRFHSNLVVRDSETSDDIFS